MGKLGKFVFVSAVAVVGTVSALLAIGSDVEAEFAKSNAAEIASQAPPLVAETDSTAPSASRFGSTMLEQAIFDAFPLEPPKTKAERRNAQNAADFVGATINAAGHLCARLIEVQEAAPGQYGIGCVMQRDGSGRANYLIDSRTGAVDKI